MTNHLSDPLFSLDSYWFIRIPNKKCRISKFFYHFCDSKFLVRYSILMVSQKVEKHVSMSFRRKPESSKFNDFWMPVKDPVLSGDQVRHDAYRTFYEFINIQNFNFSLHRVELLIKSLYTSWYDPLCFYLRYQRLYHDPSTCEQAVYLPAALRHSQSPTT